MAGHWRGKPAIAFSLAMDQPSVDRDWSAAEKIAADITRAQVEGQLPPDLLLNANVPHQPYEEIAAIIATRMAGTGTSGCRIEANTRQSLSASTTCIPTR
jgi:broad specificity polyphosphatase/5'/3'-nucleotidase SurE